MVFKEVCIIDTGTVIYVSDIRPILSPTMIDLSQQLTHCYIVTLYGVIDLD